MPKGTSNVEGASAFIHEDGVGIFGCAVVEDGRGASVAKKEAVEKGTQ